MSILTEQKQSTDLCSMTLYEIWQAHWPSIANQNAWACLSRGCPTAQRNACFRDCQNTAHREQACITAKNYGEYIQQLYSYLTMPIARITPQDIITALEAVKETGGKKGTPYSESTMGLFLSAIKATLRFADPSSALLAHLNGKAPRQEISSNKKKRKSLPSPKHERYRVRGVKGVDGVKKLSKDFFVRIKKYTKKKTFADALRERRALTLDQDEKFIRLIMADLFTDSRAIGLAIVRYTGVRPAELLYLKWKHFKFFSDGSGRMFLIIENTVDRNGKVNDHTKTENAVRPIPICGELHILINRYLQHLKEVTGKDNIGNLPVCGSGQKFKKPYKYQDLVNYAAAILREVIGDTGMLPYVRSFFEDFDREKYKENIRLYLLRKTFYTGLMGQAQLSAEDKYYVMGHEIPGVRKNMRGSLDEDYLKKLMNAMDNIVVSAKLHEMFVQETITSAGALRLENRGISCLSFNLDTLPDEFEVEIKMTSEEIGGELCFSLPPWLAGLIEFDADSFPKKESEHQGINTEFLNHQAHVKYLNSETPVTERTNDSSAGVFCLSTGK